MRQIRQSGATRARIEAQPHISKPTNRLAQEPQPETPAPLLSNVVPAVTGPADRRPVANGSRRLQRQAWLVGAGQPPSRRLPAHRHRGSAAVPPRRTMGVTGEERRSRRPVRHDHIGGAVGATADGHRWHSERRIRRLPTWPRGVTAELRAEGRYPFWRRWLTVIWTTSVRPNWVICACSPCRRSWADASAGRPVSGERMR